MKYDVLLIDLQNLYCRAYFANESLTFDNGHEVIKTGGIFSSIMMIKRFIRDYLEKDGHVYILADNPTSKLQDRKLIDPSYKLNRIERPREFYRGLELLSAILLSYEDNFHYIQVPGIEADDFVPTIIDMINTDKNILLISSDMDWARSINYHNHKVIWYNFKEEINENIFESMFNFPPTEQNIISYKTYRGDKSDNIESGLPNIRERLILKMLEYGTVDDILNDIDIIDFIPKEWKEIIKSRKSRLLLNQQLVSFYPIELSKIKEFLVTCKYKPFTLKILYESIGFDIHKIDSRVYDIMREKKESKKKSDEEFDEFFRIPKTKRL